MPDYLHRIISLCQPVEWQYLVATVHGSEVECRR
jgi:hypothetical protein